MGNATYLVNVSFCVGEVPYKSPGAEEGPEDGKADDVRTRVISRRAVVVGIILEALTIVRLRKHPFAFLFLTLPIWRIGRHLVEVRHDSVGCMASSFENYYNPSSITGSLQVLKQNQRTVEFTTYSTIVMGLHHDSNFKYLSYLANLSDSSQSKKSLY